MNYVWSGMIILAVISGIATGRMQQVTDSIINGGYDAVGLCLKLLGMLCLWSGLTKIADKAGLAAKVSKILSPLLHPLFPGLDKNSPAAKAMSMNITSNLLGLGNASTPLGLQAMSELQKQNPNPTEATNYMITFIVLNTASLKLIPTTIAMLRQQYGSAGALDIMPAAWLSSIVALASGMIFVRLFGMRRKKHE